MLFMIFGVVQDEITHYFSFSFPIALHGLNKQKEKNIYFWQINHHHVFIILFSTLIFALWVFNMHVLTFYAFIIIGLHFFIGFLKIVLSHLLSNYYQHFFWLARARAQNFPKNYYFLSPDTHTCTCAYQGVRNVCFPENFAHVLYEWYPMHFKWYSLALCKLRTIGYLYFKFCFVYFQNVKLQIRHMIWNLN